MLKKNGVVVLLLIVLLSLGTLMGCTPSGATDPEIELSPLGGDEEVADSPEIAETVVPDSQVSPLYSPPETPLPPMTVVDGAAGVQGYIGYRDKSALGPVYVWFCPFTPNATGIDGIYVLDTATHTRLEIGMDGWFQGDNIEPGKYVLVTGADPESSYSIEDGERLGHAKVFEFVEGEILEIAVDANRITIPTE